MSAKALSEYTGKELLYRHLHGLDFVAKPEAVPLSEFSDFDEATKGVKWIQDGQKGVIKPDQQIKRRGKHGLVKLGPVPELKAWFNEKKGQYVQVGRTNGRLSQFIVEPLCPHKDEEEAYIAIYSRREHDVILFYEQGGVDIGDVDAKARSKTIDVQLKTSEMSLTDGDLDALIGPKVKADAKKLLTQFIRELYEVYKNNYFTYLEINPLVVSGGQVHILDLAARLDETAYFLCSESWKTRKGEPVVFPAPFGRDLSKEEKYIAELDAKTGASLKLTILNRNGRIWTMVAGGGASVVFTDTVCDLGGASELANYGEYSGDPSEGQTFEYAKTLITIMTEGAVHPKGKVLIIGGSIANFTNVAATFKGIIRALETYAEKLKQHNVTIYVRRGGPNYQEGLRMMKEEGTKIGLPIYVYGPETHMTAIVGAALGVTPLPEAAHAPHTTGQFLLTPERNTAGTVRTPEPPVNSSAQPETPQTSVKQAAGAQNSADATLAKASGRLNSLFDANTKAIIWGQQTKAIQGMLDFDYVCSRATPSVVASTYPFTGDHRQKYYFGQKEVLIPSYKSLAKSINSHPDATVMVTFASLRSVFDTVMEALDFPQLRCICIIAEGVPENQTRAIIKKANEKGIVIIGPATVGGIKPACFKIGNAGGLLDNLLASKLYRAGSVAYVSRSGGMSNELNNIISHNTDGVFEGIAIGGDRYPGSTYTDHVLRYQDDDRVKMIVLLGELGGEEEYKIVRALESKRITKPLIAWCIGTCADHITSDVQFGHAGASANAKSETAAAKNEALRKAGAFVPESFNDLGLVIERVYKELVQQGTIVPQPEIPPPPVPMDYAWARELGLIRKPASFMTSICDERGEELLYAGVPITRVLEEDLGVGGVLSLLWFQKRLPAYANKFIEICLILTADHGPAVSGAHNTIVCARAGKDLISSLVSGLLTIGDRFGGALDGAAKSFSEAIDAGLSPMQFVNEQRRLGKLIPGIGHRVKSINNPDRRVEILKKFALDRSKFKQETPLLDFALKVEQITTSKKPNLILNVDGAIGAIFVDILRHSGMFTQQEAQEAIEIGALNGLFVLGRSMGFIGHYLDQCRLKQGLYRHPWDDISYILPDSQMFD
ncbi:ATP-citrate synthase [Aphelenchoides fujianensis]|nr:ATP-citrate synthase [Aphelenchoides fujianensis]KAI6243129.1 ATP-citrate synthase [Aphelenchoides fujianensis]